MTLSRLKGTPGHLLRRAQQASAAIFAEEMLEYDLTSVQFLALAAIIENIGLDATRLADMVDCDKATIGGVIERLERKGLVERHPSETDKRIKVLKARPAAWGLVRTCLPQVEIVQQRLLAPLSAAERPIFLLLLAKIAREGG